MRLVRIYLLPLFFTFFFVVDGLGIENNLFAQNSNQKKSEKLRKRQKLTRTQRKLMRLGKKIQPNKRELMAKSLIEEGKPANTQKHKIYKKYQYRRYKISQKMDKLIMSQTLDKQDKATRKRMKKQWKDAKGSQKYTNRKAG